MSDSVNNGGPAFPVSGMQHDGGFHGMTLRDYFATKAMQGVLANPDKHYYNNDLAEYAYKVSDCMLRARGES